MADGGEGTVQSLVDATGGQIVKVEVSGPMGVRVMASYGLLGDGKTAVIEMAEASGLPLVPKEQRDPLVATTYGTGELIADAIKRGVTEIILGIGGSATNDAGAGLAQALGVRFLNFGGAPIRDLISGGDLDDVQAVDMSAVNPGLANIHISVACDVTNPLCGEKGASRVYGPQKGATPEMVERLDKNLAHFAHIIKRSIGADVIDRPGAGAGGGIGAGLMAFTNSTLKRGVELVVAATQARGPHAGRRSRHHRRGSRRLPDRLRQDAFGRCGGGAQARRAGGSHRRRSRRRRRRRLRARHRRAGVGDPQRHAARRGDQEVAAVSARRRRARRPADRHRSADGEVGATRFM